MTALLLKDWMVNRITVILSILILVAFNISNFMGVWNVPPPIVLPVSFMFLAYLLTPISFYHDEQSNLLQFAFSSPLSRTEYVRSKYLVGWLIGGAGIVTCFSVFLAILHMPWDSALLLTSVGFLLSQLIPSIMLPFFLRFGTQKGRILMVIAYFILFFSFGIAKFIVESFAKTIAQWAVPMSVLALLVFAIGIGMSWFSYLLSVRIIEATEY